MSDQINKAYSDLVQPAPQETAEQYNTRVRRQRRLEHLITAAVQSVTIVLVICLSAMIGALAAKGELY